MRRVAAGLGLAALAAAAPGCDRLPGRPAREDRYRRPAEVVSFDQLYGAHCAGCHGEGGRLGAARPLNDALYLAVVPDEALSRIIAGGVAGTMMPAFEISAGGDLTGEQVDLIVSGMRHRWAKPEAFAGLSLPPWAEAHRGDPGRGRQVFASACGRCHGADGRGGPTAGSVVDADFLELSSDQALRWAVIAGRPDLGQPDYRSVDPAGPLSHRQIDNVVAWLAAQRQPE